MTKEQEKQFEQFEKLFKEKLKDQFTNGMKQGAYGIAGAIHDMIQKYEEDDYKLILDKIEEFLIPALGLNKKS